MIYKEIRTMTNELKNRFSRVCSLGKRLFRNTDRKEAFRQAWAIVKNSLEIRAAGTSFGRRPEALNRLVRYAPSQIRAVAVAEPSNPVDPAAVAIMVGVQGGRGLYKIGYVPRAAAPVVAALRTLPAARVVGDTVKGLRLRFTV
jgi:hypothetical protein